MSDLFILKFDQFERRRIAVAEYVDGLVTEPEERSPKHSVGLVTDGIDVR
jgi:hypothetical protein